MTIQVIVLSVQMVFIVLAGGTAMLAVLVTHLE